MNFDLCDHNGIGCVDGAGLLPPLVVISNDLIGRTDHLHPAPFQEEAALAKVGDGPKIMRHENYRGPVSDHRIHALDAFPLKEIITNAQDFIDKQYVRIYMRGNRKPQTSKHTRRVSFDRSIDKLLELGESNDSVETPADLFPRHTQNRTVQINVLTASKILMESGTDFDKRRDTTRHMNRAPGRPHNAGKQLKNGALARSVGTDDAEGLASLHTK